MHPSPAISSPASPAFTPFHTNLASLTHLLCRNSILLKDLANFISSSKSLLWLTSHCYHVCLTIMSQISFPSLLFKTHVLTFSPSFSQSICDPSLKTNKNVWNSSTERSWRNSQLKQCAIRQQAVKGGTERFSIRKSSSMVSFSVLISSVQIILICASGFRALCDNKEASEVC